MIKEDRRCVIFSLRLIRGLILFSCEYDLEVFISGLVLVEGLVLGGVVLGLEREFIV